MAYQSLNEIIHLNMQIEKKFLASLNTVQPSFSSDEARPAFESLRRRMNKDLESIRKIDQSDFEKIEYVKEVPDTQIEAYFPDFTLDNHSNPMTILEEVLIFQQKHLEFYTHLREVVAYNRSKDICDMLIKFKLGQVKTIEELIHNHELIL